MSIMIDSYFSRQKISLNIKSRDFSLRKTLNACYLDKNFKLIVDKIVWIIYADAKIVI